MHNACYYFIQKLCNNKCCDWFYRLMHETQTIKYQNVLLAVLIKNIIEIKTVVCCSKLVIVS